VRIDGAVDVAFIADNGLKGVGDDDPSNCPVTDLLPEKCGEVLIDEVMLAG
jgi:hypothetical protein